MKIRKKEEIKEYKRILKKYLYLILVVASSLIMTLAGLFMLSASGERYGDQPALVATAVNMLEKRLSPGSDEPDMIDIASLQPGGAAPSEYDEEDEYEYEDDEEDEDDESLGDEAAGEGDPESSDPGDDRDGADETVEENDESGEDPSKNKNETGEDPANNNETGEDSANNKNESGDESAKADNESGKDSSKKKDRSGEDSSKDKKPDDKNKDKKEADSSSGKKKKKKKTKWETVDQSYFDDALFIGDSRQQGFGMYSGLDNATTYAVKSYTVKAVSTKPLVDTPFGKITLIDALALNQHRFKKVYIMFGINEMGSGSAEDMAPYYYNLIDYVKLTQPGAVIYLESIIHVTASTAAKRPALSNEKINERNVVLKQIAADEGIIYLDLNEVLTDENGALFSDAASDGIHLKSQYIGVMKDYIMSHAKTPKLKKRKKAADDELMVDEYGYTYIELTPAQQLFKNQLDAYYAAAALNATPGGQQ